MILNPPEKTAEKWVFPAEKKILQKMHTFLQQNGLFLQKKCTFSYSKNPVFSEGTSQGLHEIAGELRAQEPS